jgi:hypothetical protein
MGNNQTKRGRKIEEINRHIDRFDTLELRQNIVESMEKSIQNNQTSSIAYLKLYKFKQIAFNTAIR